MPIFVAVHGAIDKSKTFSQDSAGQTLIDYVTGEDLVLDGGAIKLDEVLINPSSSFQTPNPCAGRLTIEFSYEGPPGLGSGSQIASAVISNGRE